MTDENPNQLRNPGLRDIFKRMADAVRNAGDKPEDPDHPEWQKVLDEPIDGQPTRRTFIAQVSALAAASGMPITAPAANAAIASSTSTAATAAIAASETKLLADAYNVFTAAQMQLFKASLTSILRIPYSHKGGLDREDAVNIYASVASKALGVLGQHHAQLIQLQQQGLIGQDAVTDNILKDPSNVLKQQQLLQNPTAESLGQIVRPMLEAVEKEEKLKATERLARKKTNDEEKNWENQIEEQRIADEKAWYAYWKY